MVAGFEGLCAPTVGASRSGRRRHGVACGGRVLGRVSKAGQICRSVLGLLLFSSLYPGPQAHRVLLTGILSSSSFFSKQKVFMRRGHSHNDYHQRDPLSSALRHGLSSVEVDVFPRNNVLLVGHTIFELDPSRTIENMYIRPILRRLRRQEEQEKAAPESSKRHHHLTNQEDDALTLLIDIKADPEKSMALLHEAIAPLRPYLTRVDKDGNVRKGKVKVLISGKRPKTESLFSPQGDRCFFVDGRAKDVHDNTDTLLVPQVSLPWRHLQVARVMGRGEDYLRSLTEKAHKQGKVLRVWGAPNKEDAWRQMLRDNVDLLSVDDHGKFAQFASVWVLEEHKEDRQPRIWGTPNSERAWRQVVRNSVGLPCVDGSPECA